MQNGSSVEIGFVEFHNLGLGFKSVQTLTWAGKFVAGKLHEARIGHLLAVEGTHFPNDVQVIGHNDEPIDYQPFSVAEVLKAVNDILLEYMVFQ